MTQILINVVYDEKKLEKIVDKVIARRIAKVAKQSMKIKYNKRMLEEMLRWR